MSKIISERKRQIIFKESNCKCSICGIEIQNNKENCFYNNYMNIDHILPKSLGGSHELENLRAACRKCNCKRRNYSSHVLEKIVIENINKLNIEKYADFVIDDIKNGILDIDSIKIIKKKLDDNYKKNSIQIERILKNI